METVLNAGEAARAAHAARRIASLPLVELRFADSALSTSLVQLQEDEKTDKGASDRGGAAAASAGFRMEDLSALLADPDSGVFTTVTRLLGYKLFGKEQLQKVIEGPRVHLLGLLHLLPLLRTPPTEGMASPRLGTATLLLWRFWFVESPEWARIMGVGTPGGVPVVDALTLTLSVDLFRAFPRLMAAQHSAVLDAWLGPSAGATPPPPPGSPPARHVGITCTSCKQEIVGPRFKCSQCTGLDLCEGCNAGKLVVPYGDRLHTRSHGTEAHLTPLPRCEAPGVICCLHKHLQLMTKCVQRLRLLLDVAERDETAASDKAPAADAATPAISATASTSAVPPSTASSDASASVLLRGLADVDSRLPFRPAAAELRAALALTAEAPFCSALLTALTLTLNFATAPVLFDIKLTGIGRTTAVTACTSLLTVLSAGDDFVSALTADGSFPPFLLKTLCQPASMQDVALSVANSGLRLLVDIAAVPGQAERLVVDHSALLWLAPLTHHQRPYIALKASLIVGILLHLTPPSQEPGLRDMAADALASALVVCRTFEHSKSGLANLSPRCIRILADMADGDAGTAPESKTSSMAAAGGAGAAPTPSSLSSPTWRAGLDLVGLHGLAQLVASGVVAADWPALQGLGPAFFARLTAVAARGHECALRANLAAVLLTALGHTLPPVAVKEDVSSGGSDRTGPRSGARDRAPAYLGLHLLRRPVREWDTDAVSLWVSCQSFHCHEEAFRTGWITGRVLLHLTDVQLAEMGVTSRLHRRAVLTAIARLAASPTRGSQPTLDFAQGLEVQRGRDGEDPGACDVFITTPCEGGTSTATILRAQLLACGLRVGGWVPPPALTLVEIHAKDGGGAAVSRSGASSDDDAARAVSRTSVASASLVLVVLAPRTLTLGQSVGPVAAALPSCLPAQRHAALASEVAAALRQGRQVLAVATDPFVWPEDVSGELAALRGVVDPPAQHVAPLPTVDAAAPPAAEQAGAAATAPVAASAPAPAAPESPALPAPSADGGADFALPRPTAAGGMFVRLAPHQFLLAGGTLAAAIAAHVTGVRGAA